MTVYSLDHTLCIICSNNRLNGREQTFSQGNESKKRMASVQKNPQVWLNRTLRFPICVKNVQLRPTNSRMASEWIVHYETIRGLTSRTLTQMWHGSPQPQWFLLLIPGRRCGFAVVRNENTGHRQELCAINSEMKQHKRLQTSRMCAEAVLRYQYISMLSIYLSKCI